MYAIRSATALYNRFFNRINLKDPNLSLSAGFATKLHHKKISKITEGKLQTLFNRTLRSDGQRVSTPERVDSTTRELSKASKYVQVMPEGPAKSSLLQLISAMNVELSEEIRLSSPAQNSPANLTDFIRQYWHKLELDESMINEICAFVEVRFGYADLFKSESDAREWTRLRKSAECASLSDAKRELECALVELSRIRYSPVYTPLCNVLCTLKGQIERDISKWHKVLEGQLAEGKPSHLAQLAVSCLGKVDPTVQMVRINHPDFIRQHSSEIDASHGSRSRSRDQGTSDLNSPPPGLRNRSVWPLELTGQQPRSCLPARQIVLQTQLTDNQ